MSGAGSRPEDGVVVFKVTRRSDLQAGQAALVAAGLPAAGRWRDNLAYRTGGTATQGEGELLVRAEDVERARAVLATWDAACQDRIRGHLRGLPADLALMAAWIGFAVLGVWLLGDHGRPLWLASVGVGLVVGGFVLRRHLRGRAHPT